MVQYPVVVGEKAMCAEKGRLWAVNLFMLMLVMKSNSKIIDHYVVGSDGNAVRDMAQTVYLSEYERNLNY